MEEGKASIGSLELPTGFRIGDQTVRTIKFREMAGPEEDILASNMPVTQKLNDVMAGCTQAIGDVVDPAQIRALIPKLVISDKMLYLVHLRCLSLGTEYGFTCRCPECKKESKLKYDLRQIVVTNPPPADKLINELVLPSGKKIRWKVADGIVEQTIEKSATDRNAATIGLFARITEIDDLPPKLSDVVGLSMRDRSKLREEINLREGDFDDTFDARCDACGHEYRAELEIDGRSFFSL